MSVSASQHSQRPFTWPKISTLLWVAIIAFAVGSCIVAQAEETKSPYTNESQAAIVQTSGNSETESYSLKQLSTYVKDKDTYKATASYLKTATNSTETALKWDAGLRYERALSELWSAFAGHQVESDKYAGYWQRYNTDVGGKYIITKTDKLESLAEAGYRYTHENNAGDATTHYNSIRTYIEGVYKINETNSAKLFVEYLPNIDEADDYQVNTEASLSSAINTMFSLKVAYLLKYDNVPAATATERTDKTLTTALVAKF
jgi:putative salt-induced outer membrane protein